MERITSWLALVVVVLRALLMGGLVGVGTAAAFDFGPVAAFVDQLARALCASL